MPDNSPPVSLACCCFKLLEHLAHARIAVHMSNQLHPSQGGLWWVRSCDGGFLRRCLADAVFHPHVAFEDIKMAFDTSWVESTLVLLHEAGMTGQLWGLIAHFLRRTQSQVQFGALLSEPWEVRGTAQGRVLSPLFSTFLMAASPTQSTSPLQV